MKCTTHFFQFSPSRCLYFFSAPPAFFLTCYVVLVMMTLSLDSRGKNTANHWLKSSFSNHTSLVATRFAKRLSFSISTGQSIKKGLSYDKADIAIRRFPVPSSFVARKYRLSERYFNCTNTKTGQHLDWRCAGGLINDPNPKNLFSPRPERLTDQ